MGLAVLIPLNQIVRLMKKRSVLRESREGLRMFRRGHQLPQ
jgi:hypothetical protein